MNEIEKCLNCKKPYCDNCSGSYSTRKKFSDDEKQSAIDRHTNGEPIRKIAREIGADITTVRYWCKHGISRKTKR